MVKLVGLGVFDGVHHDVRVVVLDDAAILKHDASLHPLFGVFRRLDFDLQGKWRS